jgi:cell division protein FtsB
MPIPWTLLIKQAPALVAAAGQLVFDTRNRRAAVVAATDLQALRPEVAQLASDQQTQAVLIKDLTGQLEAVTKAARVTQRLAMVGFVTAAVGVLLSFASLWIALSR